MPQICDMCGKTYKLIATLTDVEVKELEYVNSKIFAVTRVLSNIETLEYSKNVEFSIKVLYSYKRDFSIQKSKLLSEFKKIYNVKDDFYIINGGVYVYE